MFASVCSLDHSFTRTTGAPVTTWASAGTSIEGVNEGVNLWQEVYVSGDVNTRTIDG